MSATEAPEPSLDAAPSQGLAGPVLKALDDAVERLRFGVVQLIVHDGKVVQLDVTEKHRF